MPKVKKPSQYDILTNVNKVFTTDKFEIVFKMFDTYEINTVHYKDFLQFIALSFTF